jgi:hypothetical protein
VPLLPGAGSAIGFGRPAGLRLRYSSGMRRSVFWFSGWLCVGLGVVSCGGQAGDGDSPGAGGSALSGGSSASGGVSAGGSKTGGSSSGGSAGGASTGGQGSGGLATGGVATGGSASGGSATGGSGAGGGLACSTPVLLPCDAGLVNSVYFDSETGTCRPGFGYCRGDSAPDAAVFGSLAECLSACAGAAPSPEACDSDAECILDTGCCAPCEPWSLGYLDARNGTAPPELCAPQPCAACAVPSELERNAGYFWPKCQNHSCRVVDLTQGASAACTQTSDCFLREGSGCCTGCSGAGYVPLSNTDHLGSSCDSVGCPACVSPEPTDVAAYCDPGTQHCVKVEVAE